jgi:hypothetical protein
MQRGPVPEGRLKGIVSSRTWLFGPQADRRKTGTQFPLELVTVSEQKTPDIIARNFLFRNFTSSGTLRGTGHSLWNGTTVRQRPAQSDGP